MSEPLRFVMLIWPMRLQDRMAGLIVLDMMPQGLGTTSLSPPRYSRPFTLLMIVLHCGLSPTGFLYDRKPRTKAV